MKIKFFKTFLAWMVITIAVTYSSCDYLSIEGYVDKQLQLDSVFKQLRYLEAYMWGATNYLPGDEGAIFTGGYTPGPMATDEAFTLLSESTYQGMGYVMGNISSTNLGNFNNWHTWYQAIRQCNTVLQRMGECVDCLPDTDFPRILGYTKFIRAYAYYLILMNYGPFINVGDEVVANNEQVEFYDKPRDLYDDCVEYVCGQFEEAAKNLPIKHAIIDYGRPTRGAAYALVARLRLQHASEQFNGGTSARLNFGSWRRSYDDQHYIQQTYDPRRWAVAAAACKRVIYMEDIPGVKYYKLHKYDLYDHQGFGLPQNVTSDPNYYNDWNDDPFAEGVEGGAHGICPYHSYVTMFNGEAVMTSNPEFIWACQSRAMLNSTQTAFPFTVNGSSGLGITQKIIDAYSMVDGRSIYDSSNEYPYNETEFLMIEDDENGNPIEYMNPFLQYRLYGGVNNMYVNREARFYASIGFSGCFWENRSSSQVGIYDYIAHYYVDSPDGKEGVATNPERYPITGYVLKKWVHPSDAWIGAGASRFNKPYPIIRYAEILLGYAEALNQIDGSYEIEMDGKKETFTRDKNHIRRAFNAVRYRAGLPGLNEADLESPSYVYEKIKNECMIEFLCENRRYFDVRRWGDYYATESIPITGMNTNGNREIYFQRTVPSTTRIVRRVVDRKMIFLPLPNIETKRLQKFDQNPGW
ncbi:MAG: RagB/SusD family nutrient uptake outer membrane protein [Bacteroidales bacterium]|jgi:hypothetical protein|nr:RagB/SusD family nutrient uptake outer membrane protein [Bacteroidales bacterium]